jgi:hypothetical protein
LTPDAVVASNNPKAGVAHAVVQFYLGSPICVPSSGISKADTGQLESTQKKK